MMEEEKNEGSAKVMVLGKNGVGKTALIVRGLTRRFLPEYAPSKETVYKYKQMRNGKPVEMCIVDSDGQNTSSYSAIDAFVLVYAVTKKKTLQALESLVDKIRLLNQNDAMVIVVGNQTDLVQNREVSFYEGKSFASRLGAEYFEVSAADDVEAIVGLFFHVFQSVVLQETKAVTRSEKIKNLFKRRGST